jgi:predicted metal-dependent hydrolase
MELLMVRDFRVEVEYKRIKTLRMTLYPPAAGAFSGNGDVSAGGRIHVSAPLATSRQFIQNFVIAKAAWIERHQARFRRNSPGLGELRNDELCYVWGLPHRLELVERRGRPRILAEGGRLCMVVRPGASYEQRRCFLDKWYRGICEEAAARITKLWEARVGVTVNRIYYRKMKSHWGSCNYINHTIRLNTELAKKSPECLDYVILHEIIHLLEPAHNRNFYRLMDRYLPAWRAIRTKMNRGEL